MILSIRKPEAPRRWRLPQRCREWTLWRHQACEAWNVREEDGYVRPPVADGAVPVQGNLPKDGGHASAFAVVFIVRLLCWYCRLPYVPRRWSV